MLLGITVIRNEADIVEAALRLNLRFLDHIHVIDNGSTDGTLEILEAMAEELPALSVASDPRNGHIQTRLINKFLVRSAPGYAPLHVVPLDGDEILRGDPAAFRAECGASEHPIDLAWRTYVPTADDDPGVANPVKRLRFRRAVESPRFSKSTVPGTLLGKARLTAGSHQVHLNGKRLKSHLSRAATLAHFPVRSSDQITAKALLGHWNLVLRHARPSEGKQWHNIARKILETGELGEEAFLEAGADYIAHQRAELIEDPVWPDDMTLRYGRPGGYGALHKLATFTEQLVCRLAEEDGPEGRTAPDEGRSVRVTETRALPRQARLVRTSYRGVPVEFCVTHPRDAIQKHHLEGRFYEEEELDIIARHFKPGGTFVDIGSNVGNHAVFCGLFLDPSRIILAEPNPVAIRVLTANIQINGLQDICDTSRLGIGIGAENSDTAAIGWRIDRWQNRNLGGAHLETEGGDLKIMRGDDFLADDSAAFIKIDVEGMEIAVLEGLSETIRRDRPTMFVEVDNRNLSAMQDWMAANGYRVGEEFSRYKSNVNYLCLPAT